MVCQCQPVSIDTFTHQTTYQQLADLEVAPHAELVVRVDLPDGHPFVVGSNGSELPVGKACAGGGEATANSGVVAISGTGLPSLVCDLMVVLRDRMIIRYTRRIKMAIGRALTLDKIEGVRGPVTDA